MTQATQITLLRILLIPFFVGFLVLYGESHREGEEGQDFYRWAALLFFFVASLSDAVDGYLAKHCNQSSALGALLDPLADKALMLSAVVMLSLVGVQGLERLPNWLVILVLGSDFILVLGYGALRLRGRAVLVQPHWAGKLSTFFQMAAVILILLKLELALLGWLVVGAGICTGLSLIVYLLRGWKWMRVKVRE
jgi:cardiolipin synthase (CMP-forming)